MGSRAPAAIKDDSAGRRLAGDRISSRIDPSTAPDDATERPLSFAADMVRAVYAGRKTQTRRPMYPQPDRVKSGRFFRADGREIVCPFGIPGDRLWVRERFAETEDGAILYAADPIKGRSRLTWLQSREMLQEDSRLTLRVLAIGSQRLQDISEADARAEGYDPARESLPPIKWFARLWDRLSPIESLRWAANPWLWVVRFEIVDEFLQAASEAAPATQPAASPLELSAETKPRTRSVRTATIQEKHRLAEMLRSRSNGQQGSCLYRLDA